MPLLRKALAEFIGTALLLIAVVGSGIAAQRLSPTDVGLELLENAVVTGAALVAIILVPAPFADASALVTVERGTIRRYWVTQFTGNSGMVDVPIRLDDVPNEYVTSTLYHGWRGTLAPDWRTGTAELHVRVDPRHLQVHLSQPGGSHHPGDTVAYAVSTTDMSGKATSAQVSLALVDTSVLAIKNETNANILSAFYAEQPLGVSTSSEGALSIDHLTYRPDFPLQTNNTNAHVAAAPAVPPGPGRPTTVTCPSGRPAGMFASEPVTGCSEAVV